MTPLKATVNTRHPPLVHNQVPMSAIGPAHTLRSPSPKLSTTQQTRARHQNGPFQRAAGQTAPAVARSCPGPSRRTATTYIRRRPWWARTATAGQAASTPCRSPLPGAAARARGRAQAASTTAPRPPNVRGGRQSGDDGAATVRQYAMGVRARGGLGHRRLRGGTRDRGGSTGAVPVRRRRRGGHGRAGAGRVVAAHASGSPPRRTHRAGWRHPPSTWPCAASHGGANASPDADSRYTPGGRPSRPTTKWPSLVGMQNPSGSMKCCKLFWSPLIKPLLRNTVCIASTSVEGNSDIGNCPSVPLLSTLHGVDFRRLLGALQSTP